MSETPYVSEHISFLGSVKYNIKLIFLYYAIIPCPELRFSPPNGPFGDRTEVRDWCQMGVRGLLAANFSKCPAVTSVLRYAGRWSSANRARMPALFTQDYAYLPRSAARQGSPRK